VAIQITARNAPICSQIDSLIAVRVGREGLRPRAMSGGAQALRHQPPPPPPPEELLLESLLE
jgi:hypothetical protein